MGYLKHSYLFWKKSQIAPAIYNFPIPKFDTGTFKDFYFVEGNKHFIFNISICLKIVENDDDFVKHSDGEIDFYLGKFDLGKYHLEKEDIGDYPTYLFLVYLTYPDLISPMTYHKFFEVKSNFWWRQFFLAWGWPKLLLAQV